jgi:hypothetical protein
MNGLFANLLIIAISVGIFITYLRPTFAVVEANQDSITQYENEVTKVQTVNARLAKLESDADQLTSDDRNRMYTYLPNEVDIVAVQRDIYLMAQAVGIKLQDLSAAEGVTTPPPEDGSVAERSQLLPYQFEVQFAASYDDIKKFLAALEQNHYPLHVSSLTIGGNSGSSEEETENLTAGMLTVTMTVTTYALVMNESAY